MPVEAAIPSSITLKQAANRAIGWTIIAPTIPISKTTIPTAQGLQIIAGSERLQKLIGWKYQQFIRASRSLSMYSIAQPTLFTVLTDEQRQQLLQEAHLLSVHEVFRSPCRIRVEGTVSGTICRSS